MQERFRCLKLSDGVLLGSKDWVVEEVPLSIFINGRHFTTAMISPEMSEEFIIGNLFSERIIGSIQEIESLQIEENTAKIVVKNPLKAIKSKKTIVSGCGGNSSFLDETKLPQIKSNLKIHTNDLLKGVKSILDSDLHRATGGVHIVGLLNTTGKICIVEDIGRHNALDKAIGYGLKRDVSFNETFIACTGRISSEIALKCAAANIPIIASKGATTSLAINIAEKTGLCIVAFVRGRRLNIYTNPERVADQD